MIWFPALLLFWKGIITEGCGTVNPFLNEIIAPSVINYNNALEILACLAGNDNSESMGETTQIQAGSTTYRKKILCAEAAACARAGAWPLQSRGVSACAEEAAENRLNSFYIDDQGQCLSSNFRVVEESESCSSTSLEVYASDDQLSDYTSPPDVNNFALRNFASDMSSFTIEYQPACLGAYYYEFHRDGRMIDDVASPGKRITLTTPLPVCTDISPIFALQAYDDDGNYVGQPMHPARFTIPSVNC